MLVLSRKERESIRIGDNVVITVRRIDGNRVRLGVEAPAETLIARGELPEETTENRRLTKSLRGTDAGKDANRNATQARTDPQQYAD